MALVRNTTFWSPTQLKEDSSIPNQEDIGTGSGYISCVDINTTKIKNVIGGSTNQIYDLSSRDATFVSGGESGKINAWARYKPGYVTYNTKLPSNCYDNPSFVYNYPDRGKEGGDWAGYNHGETTKPTYWSTPPSSTYQIVIGAAGVDIKNGLARGKLCPILSQDPENEYYWDRIKIQVWKKEGVGGTYALHHTTSFIDLDDAEQVLCTLGDMDESASTTYYICLRPVYINPSDEIEAVIEGGVAVFSYYVQSIGEAFSEILSITDDGTISYMDGGRWYVELNYHIDNSDENDYQVYLKYRVIEEGSGEWQEEYYYGQTWIYAGSPGFTVDGYQFGPIGHHPTTPNTTMRVDLLISIDGSNWSDFSIIASGLTYTD